MTPRAALPRHRIARLAPAEAGPFPVSLDRVLPLAPFVRADGSTLATWQTQVRVAHDGARLLVRFDCADLDIWGTYERRDDPIWKEEVVEVFLAPGEADPVRYHEFELSPRGVLFDALVHNPARGRQHLRVETAWDCPGIAWRASADPAGGSWRAELAIPWAAVAPADEIPTLWRANFYRIERPRAGEDEYSCWSATETEPADFHRPDRFGILEVQPPPR